MRKLVLLAVILGLLAAAYLGVRAAVESQLEDRVELAARPGGEATARISSFPFLARLLTTGEVSRVEVAAAAVTVESLTFSRLAVDLDDVTLDRDRLLADRKVVLSDLRRGTAEAEVSQEELSQRLGVPVTLEAGRARVRVAGQTVTATASVRDNVLRLSVSGFAVPPLRIPRLPLVPCVADVQILPGRVRLTCTVDQVPPELVGRPLDEVRL